MQKVWLYLENGTYIEADSFGAEGTTTGEIVFNTSLTGYQEIITDPSYAGQFITFTMPEIGIVGVNPNDSESPRVFCKGVIVRSYNNFYSNFRADDSLESFLKKHNTLGICNIDTRFLTKTLRDSGAMMMIASTEISDREELKRTLESSKRIEDINYIKEVSTKESYIHKYGLWDSTNQCYREPNFQKKIIAIDFGVKRNILNELANVGFEVEVLPASFSAKNLIQRYKDEEISGVFLSNGPGDPLVLDEEVREVKELIEAKIPMFGICLGHQILSIAHGYKTYKLKFGQHGGNHPVKNSTGAVEITAQNHNYNVPDSVSEIAEVTHINLFDNTIEGLKYKNRPIFSVQHHPESSPGPHESSYIFREFFELTKKS